MTDRLRSTLTCAAALVSVLLAAPLDAQRFPGFGGLEVRGGFASAEQADMGFSFAVDVDVGYVSSPRIRGTIGLDHFSADIDRRVGGTPVGGDYSARGAVGALRIDAFTGGRAVPFAAVSLHAYSVDASSQNTAIEDLLSGFTIGAGLAAGAAISLGEEQRTFGLLQIRRVFANNIDHWNIQVGFRYLPRGAATYIAVPRRPRALRQETDIERQLVMQEQERIARERRAAELVSQEQAAADTAAARREEEQRRVATERERAHADSVARAAQERVAVAEREAAEARARAEEAEQRAAESERRVLAALADLDRLMTNVTSVRETERGLVITLGSGTFASGQAALSGRARDEVSRVAAVLAQFPDHRISVEGHTDAVGQELANQRLSEQRAESVRAALIAEGVAPQRVESVGFGQGRPVADNTTAAGRAQNRRVEIVVIGARRPAAR